MPLTAPPPDWSKIKNKPTTIAGFGITDVLATIAAAPMNSVGSFTFGAYYAGGAQVLEGQTVAGSAITPTAWDGTAMNAVSPALSGTWRILSRTTTYATWAHLFQRVA